MTGEFLLDTVALAVSLFNTMLLLWLGIVVAANADRRNGGIWLTIGGLLCSGIFFLIHSAILGRGIREYGPELDVLWQVGWLPIILSPLAWYGAILWYAGLVRPVIASQQLMPSHVRSIQLPGLVLAVCVALGLWGLILVGGALPTFAQVLPSSDVSFATPSTPVFVLLYGLYNVLCIGLSLHALRYAEPSARLMGDLARRRARPWFVAASLVLLVVSLLVSAFVITLFWLDSSGMILRQDELLATLTSFDLLVDALIAVTVALIGKAIVSYEIFTGKSLPRSGFFRQWRRAVILAGGYSATIAATLSLQVRPIYVLLLATLLIVIFYALVSVRLFGERERLMRQLRPFLVTRSSAEHISSRPESSELDIAPPFRALIESLLNARLAYLVPLGTYTPLLTSALAYPPDAVPPPHGSVTGLADKLTSPEAFCIDLDPILFNGAQWAVPLWNERGLSGALFLGEKKDHGLYTQEELEIARVTCERLMDAHASAEMTRRLIRLQQQRLAEIQVMDRRARRVLHDDVLPQLHAGMLNLNAGASTADSLAQLSALHHTLSNLLRESPMSTVPYVERHGLIGALQRTLDEELAGNFDDVQWQIEPEAQARVQTLPTLYSEVIYYAAREAMRNAARHGRGSKAARQLRLCVSARWKDGLELEIADDGVGHSPERNSLAGSGQGLAMHSTMMAIIGGALMVHPSPNGDHATRVVLTLPNAAWQ